MLLCIFCLCSQLLFCQCTVIVIVIVVEYSSSMIHGCVIYVLGLDKQKKSQKQRKHLSMVMWGEKEGIFLHLSPNRRECYCVLRQNTCFHLCTLSHPHLHIQINKYNDQNRSQRRRENCLTGQVTVNCIMGYISITRYIVHCLILHWSTLDQIMGYGYM